MKKKINNNFDSSKSSKSFRTFIFFEENGKSRRDEGIVGYNNNKTSSKMYMYSLSGGYVTKFLYYIWSRTLAKNTTFYTM